MYDTLEYTTRTDDMESNVKWACFTWEGVYYEIRATLDSEGNVDNTQTLQDCKDCLEMMANQEEIHT